MLQHVAGGYAFGAAREAAGACARLFERPVERGLSQAALETVAIVAYLGPCAAPRSRASAASLPIRRSPRSLERGLIAEAGRERPGGAVRYRATPLFERVFGLESLAALPRLDDIGETRPRIRERLLGSRSAGRATRPSAAVTPSDLPGAAAEHRNALAGAR